MPESTRYDHLDRLTRADLGQWQDAAGALDEWLDREHGILSSHHGLGALLDLLADAGYAVLTPQQIANVIRDGQRLRDTIGPDLVDAADKTIREEPGQ